MNSGVAVIKSYLKTLPDKPGVYRMLNTAGKVLYVGKAKDLKRRVASYTRPHLLTVRLKRMIHETTAMEFVITATEAEALLLEANLIKNYKPPYNVLLKDDKFFSYILITDHPWPRLMKHRGHEKDKGQYFGPFASTEAVNSSLVSLYKVFKVRSCSDSFFAARQRPCLQYHIKQCSAPCVQYISAPDYERSVKQVTSFLKGRTQVVQEELAHLMQRASEMQDYEKAAQIRDQIKALTKLQSQQTINQASLKETDVFALGRVGPKVCIQGFFYRHGRNLGTHSFFPEHIEDLSDAEILASFINLFYEDKVPPLEIMVNILPADNKVLEKALSHKLGKGVKVLLPSSGIRTQIIKQATQNAQDALERQIAHTASQGKVVKELAAALGLPTIPNRIEVYDNSHIQGSQSIGAMIVADQKGFDKKSYRKFTIHMGQGPDQVTPGDDYEMMRQVFTRRFTGSLASKAEHNPIPDLIIIDGGLGQLNAVRGVVEALGISTPLLAISKGPQRNAGNETLHMVDLPPFKLPHTSSALYFLQRLRDEAHRFAITFHRAKRQKALTSSTLDDVPGIGPGRKKALLRYFGSSQGVKGASVEDLAQTPGISKALAQIIYDYFHG